VKLPNSARRATPAAWFAALLVAPAFLADCSSADPLSPGDPIARSGNAGLGNAGSVSAGSSSAGSSNAGSTGVGGGNDTTCATSDCGPALGLANYECADGSTAGPTGRCLKRANSSCGWEVLTCPPGGGGGADSAGGAGGTGGARAGGAGVGGQASGGANGQRCGGKVCGLDQSCCGPAECGSCIPATSGRYCPNQCLGGSGGAGSGGASGGASG